MPAPKRSAIQFQQLDTAHALQARASLVVALCHLGDATTSLELGVPCENCEELRMILTFADCAVNLLVEAIQKLGELATPGTPLLDRDGEELSNVSP